MTIADKNRAEGCKSQVELVTIDTLSNIKGVHSLQRRGPGEVLFQMKYMRLW
jgi:hypothetical protein